MRKTVQMSEVESQKFKTVNENYSSALFSVFLLTAFFLLIAVSFAHGAETEAHGGNSVLKAYLWPVINFLVLVFIMVYMLKKMDVRGYFRKRTELIEQTLKEAREAKQLAEKALAEVEERLRVKDQEIQEIISLAKDSGTREKGRLAEDGQKMKEKILDQARTNIDYEVKKAKEAIKAEAVEIAMELAEKKLKNKLTKEEQLKLLDESLAKIEGKK